jgi:hypothetical protein
MKRKRIWFTQQAPLDYMPLRAGLGLITEEDLREYDPKMLCPKVFTTRTHTLDGEYYVVEGSRFRAKPVVPRIELRVEKVGKLRFQARHAILTDVCPGGLSPQEWEHFPELDLGIRGVTFDTLEDELIRLNKNASLDTVFYVHRLVAPDTPDNPDHVPEASQ